MSDNSNTIKHLQKNSSTIVLNSEYVRKHTTNFNNKGKSPSELAQNKMIVFILGMIERIDFGQTPTITVGRFDLHLKTLDQLDLSAYGAIERGVSRFHCQLEFINGQVVVTDLGSANGTYVAGNRLEANQPFALKKGEELIVGRLPIQFIAER